jgi:hypothetical protein
LSAATTAKFASAPACWVGQKFRSVYKNTEKRPVS